ncbi:hypothetical protein AUC71_08155 [Methyloceanibacter marginalis]|uniref:Uncharacterized protein n=1 Tax=Methyloceanibacter marginalis TaxID=1774971 RepID=A0A1E3WDX6_9HYPH|nr:hypothetical protein AUC71_08155 [Methyloceanibacter marginalis]
MKRRLDTRLGLRLAVIAAEQRALECVERPAFMLGARAGGEARIFGPAVRLCWQSHEQDMLGGKRAVKCCTG